MTKEAQASGETAPPASSQQRKAGRTKVRSRLAVLLIVCIVLAIVQWHQHGEQARVWWLRRQPLNVLRARATRPGADAQTRFEYAQRLLASGDADGALAVYQQAYEALPAQSATPLAEQINAHIGYLLARQGNAPEALTWLDRAHKLNDENSLAVVGYGILFAAQRKYDYAANQFRYATQLDPNNVEAWFRLGEALTEDGKARLAIPALQKAASLAPRDAAIQASLGHAHALQSQFPEAVAAFRKAVEGMPDNINYQILLGSALAQNAKDQNQYQEATRLLEAGRRAFPNDPDLAFTLGALHLRFNALADARRLLRQCVERLPRHEEAWYSLARVEQRLGNATAAANAQARYKELHELSSRVMIAEKKAVNDIHSVAARLMLADLYRQKGNWEAARAQYAIALGMQPDNAPAKTAFDALSRQIAQTPPQADAPAVSLGPPPPPDVQVYDPKHELPAFHAETSAASGNAAAGEAPATPQP